MDFKQIQELIKSINKSNIGEVSIQEGDFKITIKQKKENVQTFVNAQPIPAALPSVPVVPQIQAEPAPPAAAPKAKSAEPATNNEANYLTIKSPMIGTFYRKSSPDKPPFVEVGTEVTVGKTVCIIEAMKLFNEIESEVTGKIVKVLVEDASPVEFDQPLFLVEPI